MSEQDMEDVRDMARIETATRFLTYLVYILLGINTLILIGVAAILAILMHSVIFPAEFIAPPGP